MSCYEWENGSITIPTASWAGFKKTIRDAWNQALDSDLATIERLIAAVLATNKNKRGVNWREEIDKEMERRETTGWSGTKAIYKLKAMEDWGIARKLMPDGATRPVRLKKKDLGYATRATTSFGVDGGCISFTAASHAVTWGVSENNHACDTARETYMAGVFFQALSAMKWTRGSGGVIVGNDEYNRDDREAGGGGNRIKDRFGPAGEREYGDDRRSRMKRIMRRI